MKKQSKVIIAAALSITLLGGSFASAKSVGKLNSFKASYLGDEHFTGSIEKNVTNRKAVINLCRDSGTAWVTANMKDKSGNYYGSVTLQRGTKGYIKNDGVRGKKYRLGIRKTNDTGSGVVDINGAWSPDYKKK